MAAFTATVVLKSLREVVEDCVDFKLTIIQSFMQRLNNILEVIIGIGRAVGLNHLKKNHLILTLTQVIDNFCIMVSNHNLLFKPVGYDF